MYDYIIVGQGIAGTTLAFQLLKKKLKVVVIDNNPDQSSSKIASGLWNPIVLKRMKKVWLADEMLNSLHSFYPEIEKITNSQFTDKEKIRRIFNSTEEQNNWFDVLDKPNFDGLLSSEIEKNKNPKIKADADFGVVAESGRVDVQKYLESSKAYLKANHAYKESQILYQDIHVEDDCIKWNGFETKNMIFCEGQVSRFNPYFSYLPFAPTKGEVMIVESDLELKNPLHGGKFILPLGDNKYKVGATYNWDDLNEELTKKGTEQLHQGWDKITTASKTVLKQQAGIRPTVKDRRPLLGTHPKHNNIHIFNGLGSRGILMAPYLSECMTNYLTNNSYLHPEMDIYRFNDLHV